MSRIGKQPILIPDGVTVSTDNGVITVSAALNTQTLHIPEGITVKIEDSVVIVARGDNSLVQRSQHGLLRTLIENMVIGVSNGFTKQLEIQGVGYRAILNGSDLQLSLGFSHPVIIRAPEGITFKVEKNIITVSGSSKPLVGEIAALIRSKRKPEVYKGKGIRYVGEFVRRKAGKTAKA